MGAGGPGRAGSRAALTLAEVTVEQRLRDEAAKRAKLAMQAGSPVDPQDEVMVMPVQWHDADVEVSLALIRSFS